MTTKAEKNKLIHGVQVARKAPTVSHLFYVHDSLIFIKAIKNDYNWLKENFNAYEKASKQIINYEKSSLFFSSSTTQKARQDIQTFLILKYWLVS